MLDQLTLLERLGVFIIRDFIDIQLCRQMLAEARQVKRFHPGLVSEERKLDEDTRKVLVTRLSKPVVQTVGGKLGAIKPQLEAKFKVELVDHQGPDFLFYREGGFYGPHRDRAGGDSQRRRVTVVIFVNGERQAGKSDATKIDAYEGGNLVFYSLLEGERAARIGLSLNGQPGLLVAFDSAVLHEVKPVTRGDRVTIATWFLGE
ncbi:2OG-Fe(II) oxygenase [Candidatus Thiosymbion oneisti]|uniref:2OG-Fe(II) oxygenase n=1 Tax=Candidatus Thiosymbion oneisti TaxID=589554 RepID=UPI000B7D920F|nr:2OG-Fe(II) oxygenase [Candidatus Thiosymbion oneisti]